MSLNKIADRWHVHCGFVHRDYVDEMQRWCWQSWGSGWGEYKSLMGRSVFIFFNVNQANWFIVRWQDHFEKIDKKA